MSSLNGAYYSYYIGTGFESGDLFKSWLCSFTVTLDNLFSQSVSSWAKQTNKQIVKTALMGCFTRISVNTWKLPRN